MRTIRLSATGRLAAAGHGDDEYVVVHLVVRESFKDLVGPQVIDHMAHQAVADGPGRPARIMVGLLEPGRVAISRQMRHRLVELRSRAPEVRITRLPYVSRFSGATNAWLLAGRIRRFARGRGIVFHCRSEAAAQWAIALSPYLGGAGLVTDVRGAWPEELVFARGFDHPARADEITRRRYDRAMARLRHSLVHSGAVLTVSDRLADWLRDLGVDGNDLFCIPCCVSRIAFSAADRTRMRAQLGLDGTLVLCYAGTIRRYQHIDDGLVPFFRAAAEQRDDVRLLVLTNEPDRIGQIFTAGGVPVDRTIICRIPQREVSRYLAAADAGFLLRRPSRVNQFSQPIKLGEYLAAGLPVITSRGLGTLDAVLGRTGAGLAVDAFTSDPAHLKTEVVRTCRRLREDGELMRRNALALCERQFLWCRYTDVARVAYQRALDRRHTVASNGDHELWLW